VMTILEDDLRAALRAQAQALRVPERPALDRGVVELRRHPGPRWLIAAACLALIAAGVVALTRWRAGDPDPASPVASVVPDTAAPVTNGWVALDSDGDIYLVRPGEDARRLEVAGSDTADEACPAWSPDGTRLLFGRVTGSEETTFSDAELVIVPVGPDGAIGSPAVIALDGFEVLTGFDAHPCAVWAPDGRWVAFAGKGEVWVVDTQTDAVRRLPDLRPSDLEWRPGTDELAIAGDVGTSRAARTMSTPVSVYTVSTGELRQLGSVEAALVTWSPDGSTLAYEGGELDARELWLVDADGANERLLVADLGGVNHGIGPVWSPTADRIAYQRLCDHPMADPTRRCSEEHEVVLVSVADGTETVIEPPQTDGPNGPRWLYPFLVTWSPDGTTLLYKAFTGGVIAVPPDTPSDVTVLTDGMAGPVDYRWVPIQAWGRQPG
jgi:Tol biopolymer transport system component